MSGREHPDALFFPLDGAKGQRLRETLAPRTYKVLVVWKKTPIADTTTFMSKAMNICTKS